MCLPFAWDFFFHLRWRQWVGIAIIKAYIFLKKINVIFQLPWGAHFPRILLSTFTISLYYTDFYFCYVLCFPMYRIMATSALLVCIHEIITWIFPRLISLFFLLANKKERVDYSFSFQLCCHSSIWRCQKGSDKLRPMWNSSHCVISWGLL